MRRNRLGLAFQLERLDRFGLDRAADELERRLADQDLVGVGGVLQAGGDVDRVAGREPLLGAGDDLAGVHPDPTLDAELGERRAHLHRRPAGAQRVVLVHLRHAENGHHRVADELLHRAPVRLDDRLHPLEVARRAAPCSASGSTDSPSAVEPTTSQNSTVTTLRCTGGSSLADRANGRSDVDCNRDATERIVTKRHETSREPGQNELRRHQMTRIDTERHQPARTYADMESKKDLK